MPENLYFFFFLFFPEVSIKLFFYLKKKKYQAFLTLCSVSSSEFEILCWAGQLKTWDFWLVEKALEVLVSAIMPDKGWRELSGVIKLMDPSGHPCHQYQLFIHPNRVLQVPDTSAVLLSSMLSSQRSASLTPKYWQAYRELKFLIKIVLFWMSFRLRKIWHLWHLMWLLPTLFTLFSLHHELLQDNIESFKFN